MRKGETVVRGHKHEHKQLWDKLHSAQNTFSLNFPSNKLFEFQGLCIHGPDIT